MSVEPISLSIGAVALVSVFTTCVECFEYIDATKSCGRNLELLAIKFAIEKTRFLIWGDSVGLSSTDNRTRSTKLDSPLCRPIVEQTLNCIQLLFTDTRELTERYGLKPSDSQETASAGKPSSGFKGSSQFRVSYDRFMARIQANQQQIPAPKKVRWVIRDKKKFGCEDTRQLINGLEAITDSLELAAIRQTRIREELDSVEDLEDLGIIAEASAQSNKEWSDAASVVLENSTVADSHPERIHEWASPQPWLRTDRTMITQNQHRSKLFEVIDSMLEAPVAKPSASYRATLARKQKSWAFIPSRQRTQELKLAAALMPADCTDAAYQGRNADRLVLS